MRTVHWILKIRRGMDEEEEVASENDVEVDSQESYNDTEKRPQSGNLK